MNVLVGLFGEGSQQKRKRKERVMECEYIKAMCENEAHKKY
jgi:hypothetical protein